MARSVSTPPNTEVVAYDYVDRDDDPFFFEDLIEGAQCRIYALFPSMTPADRWLGREDRVVAENGHAWFGFSEYMGLIAYWLVPKEDDGCELHRAWCGQVSRRFADEFASLRRVGMMSNGEGVFERIHPRASA